MPDAANPSAWVVWGGFVLAFLFGAIANKTNFCTMGALSDVVNMSHWGRLRMWLLAIAVAIVGTSALYASGQIDLSKAIYVQPKLPLLSLLVGGAVFGVGMTLSGGCVNKNLVRVGGGSLRSVVVLVFVGLSAYMTLKGLFGLWRVTWLDPVALDLTQWGLAGQTLPLLVAKLTGLAARSALWLSVALVCAGLLGFIFKDHRFRSNPNQLLGGLVLGLLIPAAWYLTGHIGHGENPDTLEIVYFATNTRTLESFSFVAPVAFGLELLMLWTDSSMHITFGIASVLGVVLGSMSYALATHQFRWEGFASLQDLRTQLLGALLMGFGGVTALGCTVGQGLSGVSSLAMGSVLALASIMAGCVATLHYQNWRA